MSGNCFSRFEKKYLLTRDQYDGLREALDSCMREDIYGRYTTCNIYYDTEDDLLIRRSMQKPSYKEKLRLRSYGTPEMDTIVYLEIKKKCQGIVSKRRIPLQLREAYDFTGRGIVPGHLKSRVEEQICEEIRFFLEKYPLQRKLYLAYDRLALSGAEDPEFRVTFDTAIRSRRTGLALEKGSSGLRLLPDDLILMEVKAAGAFPVWFAGLLTESGIRPVSFSKYGNIYRREHGAPMLWVTGSAYKRHGSRMKEPGSGKLEKQSPGSGHGREEIC